MSIVLFPENLRHKLGDEAALELIDLINIAIRPVKEGALDTGSYRFVSCFSNELKADLSVFKSDLIKWMFIFWVSQIIITGEIVVNLIK